MNSRATWFHGRNYRAWKSCPDTERCYRANTTSPRNEKTPRTEALEARHHTSIVPQGKVAHRRIDYNDAMFPLELSLHVPGLSNSPRRDQELAPKPFRRASRARFGTR